ncbi:MAG: response regulator transcription factor [Leptospirales bacterium]|nr:response regulator transcription factor [Leptospirales bacterium]
MQLTCYVIEDEPPARELLFRLIERRKDLKLLGWAGDANAALNYLKMSPADLIFLDVHLPGMSGFEFLEALGLCPPVVFTTAGTGHAVPAFTYGAVDFLLKPFTEERFDMAVNRVIQSASKSATTNPGLAIREDENHYLIPFNDIIYLSSAGKASAIHTTDRDFETQKLLKDLEARMPEGFLRIHKQFIVNLAFVSHIRYRVGGGYTAFLKDSDETSLPVGRQFAAALKTRFG